MIEFADNNNVLLIIDISLFYINKGFDLRISFSLDFIDYDNIRKYLNVSKIEKITI